MKLIQTVFRSTTTALSHRFRHPQSLQAFSTSLNFDDIDDKPSTDLFAFENEKKATKEPDSDADLVQGLFADIGDTARSSSLFGQKDRGRNNNMQGFGGGSRLGSRGRGEVGGGMFGDLDPSLTTLADGMDTKLMQAARYFEYDSEEVDRNDYAYRPDVTFRLDDTYEPKDLDLTKPAVQKPFKRAVDFETSTAEVLQKADFRNVRFLANFLTDAGTLKKRNQTRISAKAQRKIAREIKTARAFGLMPFTTQGTKEFVFGRTMEPLVEDYEYETPQYDTTSFVDDSPEPV